MATDLCHCRTNISISSYRLQGPQSTLTRHKHHHHPVNGRVPLERFTARPPTARIASIFGVSCARVRTRPPFSDAGFAIVLGRERGLNPEYEYSSHRHPHLGALGVHVDDQVRFDQSKI